MSGPANADHLSALGALRLAVVCPMANERDSAVRLVTEVLDQARPFADARFFAVLDNACKDGTADLLRAHALGEPRLTVVWAPENRGVVDAYVRGYREALATGFEWILEIDAGFSHQPSDLANFLPKVAEGHDCVFGSRFCRGGRISDSSLKRKLVSWGGSRLANLLLGTRLADMTSGYEMFRREALQMVLERGIRSRGHFFQTEIKTYCRNLRICEVPIHYRAASPSLSGTVVEDALSRLWGLFLERLKGTL
jgi:dolichol-phosphate mannosyltransferase